MPPVPSTFTSPADSDSRPGPADPRCRSGRPVSPVGPRPRRGRPAGCAIRYVPDSGPPAPPPGPSAPLVLIEVRSDSMGETRGTSWPHGFSPTRFAPGVEARPRLPARRPMSFGGPGGLPLRSPGHGPRTRKDSRHERTDVRPRDRDRGSGEDLRRDPGRRRRRPGRARRHGLRRPRPERRRQDDHGEDARHPAAPRRGRGARLRSRRRPGGRRGTRPGEPDRAVRLRGRGPDRHREPGAARPAPRPRQAGGPPSCRAVAGGIRAERCGREAGQALLGRYAAPYRHRRVHPEHARPAVPRRADDRPRSTQPQPGVGHRARGGRPGHDGAADHAVSGRGGPAGVPDRGHRPGQGDRGGHEGRAEGVRGCRFRPSAAARRGPAATGRGGAAPRPRRRCAAGAGPGGADGTRRRGSANGQGAAEAAARALAELARTGITVDNFSLGQPSLDEVFLALTGHDTKAAAAQADNAPETKDEAAA